MFKKIFTNKYNRIRMIWKIILIYITSQILIYVPFRLVFNIAFLGFFITKAGVQVDNYESYWDLFKDSNKSMDLPEILSEISIITTLLIFAKYIDKFSFEELGVKVNIKAVFRFFTGILVAGTFMMLSYGFCVLAGLVKTEGFYWNLYPSKESITGFLIYQVILLIIVGFQEELFCRAYLIKNLLGKNAFSAIVISASIFSLLHLGNLQDVEASNKFQIIAFSLINIFLMGIIYGYYYYSTGDLWLVVGAHFSWNLVMGPILGLPISGDPTTRGILVTTVTGHPVFTGGNFGPEAGIIATTVLVSMFFTFKFIISRYTGGKFLEPSTSIPILSSRFEKNENVG